MSTPPQGPPPSQPGWPGAHQPPLPQGEPPKGKSKGLLIGAIIAALVVLAGLGVGGYFAFRGDSDKKSDKTSKPGSSATAGGNSDTPQPAPTTAAPTTAAPQPAGPPARDRSAVVGHWVGTYQCAQGPTKLDLKISPGPGSKSAVTAIFGFSADPSNPGVPTGSFKMAGQLANGSLRLGRVAWIHRPPTYMMVGLQASVVGNHPTTINGHLTQTSCTTFSVKRK